MSCTLEEPKHVMASHKTTDQRTCGIFSSPLFFIFLHGKPKRISLVGCPVVSLVS